MLLVLSFEFLVISEASRFDSGANPLVREGLPQRDLIIYDQFPGSAKQNS